MFFKHFLTIRGQGPEEDFPESHGPEYEYPEIPVPNCNILNLNSKITRAQSIKHYPEFKCFFHKFSPRYKPNWKPTFFKMTESGKIVTKINTSRIHLRPLWKLGRNFLLLGVHQTAEAKNLQGLGSYNRL